MRLDHLHLRLGQEIDIDRAEAGDLLVLVLDELRPAELGFRNGPAEAGSIPDLVMDMACGTQPRMTQVPPQRYSSAIPTLAP
jgi:hypothetical protein